MMRLFLFVLIAAAAWYGYTHYPELLRRPPENETLVRNETGHTVARLRVGMAGQTFVREVLEPGATFKFGFRNDREGPVEIIWEYQDSPGDLQWRGGNITPGPIPQRHSITLSPRASVVHLVQPMPAK